MALNASPTDFKREPLHLIPYPTCWKNIRVAGCYYIKVMEEIMSNLSPFNKEIREILLA